MRLRNMMKSWTMYVGALSSYRVRPEFDTGERFVEQELDCISCSVGWNPLDIPDKNLQTITLIQRYEPRLTAISTESEGQQQQRRSSRSKPVLLARIEAKK